MSTSRHRFPVRLSCVVVALLAASGCSVPRDREAHQIAPAAIPKFLQDQVLQRSIFLINGQRLRPVKKPVPLSLSPEKTVQNLLDRLRDPLTAQEQKDFFTSRLARIPDSAQEYNVTLEKVEGDLVTLDVSDAFNINEDPFALGQLVLTITDVPGLARVDFVKDAKRLSQVRTSYDSASFVATPVRKESFLQPISLTQGKLYFVAKGRLRPVDVDFDGGDPSDSPLYTAQLYVQALQDLNNLDGAPDGFTTLLPGLDATITEDAVGNFILSFSDAYTKLSTAKQALVVGQIVQSLRLAQQIPTLPTIVLVVAGKTVGTIDPDSYADLVDSVVTDPVVADTAIPTVTEPI